MPVVHIAIGSNRGDRQENCRKAIELLKQKGITPVAISTMHETEPEGVTDQLLFINMAVSAETELPPLELLAVLKEIEKQMGREETVRYGPRVIDLDLLLYGDETIDEPGLVVPHPLMHGRGFVLGPLSEIAPDAVHPVLKKTVSELKGLLNK